MKRRDFLAATSGLLLSPLVARAQGTTLPPQLPWFDPTYAQLPTYEQQTAGLSTEALAAQQEPRYIDSLPVTGLPLDLGDFDRQIVAQIKAAGLVGVSFSIAINQQLAVTRAYGYLSSRDKTVAEPTSPGYLGSITKPLCAMAGLTLVRDGKLNLDQKVLEVLPLEALLKLGEKRQPEIEDVTVRMLMNHTSGMFSFVEELIDREYYRQLASQKKLTLVHGDISQYDLVRRGMSKPFVSKPGMEGHYGGQSLQILGRMIEKISGLRLDKFISSEFLAPLGIKNHVTFTYLSPEQLTLILDRQSSVTNTFIPNPRVGENTSFESNMGRFINTPWGNADACGSSILSSVDLVRFLTFFSQSFGNELKREIVTIPKVNNESIHGLGWGVSNRSGSHQIGHGGSFSGIRAFCEYTWDDIQYGVVVAGEHEKIVPDFTNQVRDLGRALRDRGFSKVGWQHYGFE